MQVHIPKFRDLGLNETVAIELPASVWLSFVTSYGASEWNDPTANTIAGAIRNTILDPVYLKEQDAMFAEAQEQANMLPFQIMSSMRGDPPEPPDDPRITG